MRVSTLFRLLRSLPASVYFNFHYLPLRQAVKLPILLYKPRFLELKGTVRIEDDNIRTGMIKLGFPTVSLYPNSGIMFENHGGEIVFKGRTKIGNASSISIGGKGRVETERLSVCPELGAGFVSLEAQAHGQAAEKRLAQEQCAAGATHGRFGFPAYGLPLRNCPGIRGDGRIHSSFNQTITATGRISSTEPNLQNIPVRMELGRLIRKVFIPEDGYIFVDADYSQIELRVLAHMSGDEKLIEAYRQAEDIHRITASQVFHVPLEEVTPQQRRNAKAVNFGIVYGISSFGLSQDLDISPKEAREYIDRYFETYPGIKGFLDGLVAEAKEKGYATTMFGRRRPVPELKSSNFMQRSFGERVAMNSPIQGTAADIIKIAMVRVHDRLQREGFHSRLILQVHDELLIEAREDEADRVEELLRREMQQAAELKVPLEIDLHRGNNWYEAK